VIRDASPSLVVRVTARTVAPLIQIFALYVLFHGHYSPGGGFQGGVMIAASVILMRLSHGSRATQRLMPTSVATRLAALGALMFLVVGAIAFRYGGEFLDYGRIPLAEGEPMRRSYGILLVELGVALACIAALVSIYDDLAGARGQGDERDV
jgi:multicomponent Na+:H+ antiporter subunit B